MALPRAEHQSRVAASDWRDFVHTGPGTLAGRYLRRFWQPVYHGPDLLPGHAKPLRIMSEDFTLYRGEGGNAHLVALRCAHRGTQLSTGWVEGDCIRCFYHGWKYDGAGQCVEQPAEDAGFASKVKIRSYPCEEYLGLIFVYLGEGEAPPLPRYPEFEEFDGILELDSYPRACNYFNNLENSMDSTHVGFVHRSHDQAFDGLVDSPKLSAEESDWGITQHATRGENVRITHIGMPNIFHMHALPTDSGVGWRESLFWWVPIDDESHIQFGVTRVPVTGEAARQYEARRQARLANIDVRHEDLAEAILAGELRLQDVPRERTDLVRLQDDVAQAGQGRIADRAHERLGRGDSSVILIRKIWERELRALAEGRPLKQWARPAGYAPINYEAQSTG